MKQSSSYLRAVAEALRVGAGSPAILPVHAALQAYASEIEASRREGLTRELSIEEAERFFALGFALEQVKQNLTDLERCADGWSEAEPADAADENG